jgi:hypothetical protein
VFEVWGFWRRAENSSEEGCDAASLGLYLLKFESTLVPSASECRGREDCCMTLKLRALQTFIILVTACLLT